MRDIQEVKGAVLAIEASLSMAQPGDLILVQADTVDETINFMREKLVQPQHAREIVLAEATLDLESAPTPESRQHAPSVAAPVGTAHSNGHKLHEELAQVVD